MKRIPALIFGIVLGTTLRTALAAYGPSSSLPTLNGTSTSFGGSALLAGACTTNTVTVQGARTSMAATATPVTYPNDGTYWYAYVSANNTVTIKICATIASTPGASVYNVRVHQ